MLAAEDDFSAGGHQFHAGAFIIPNGRSQVQSSLNALGIQAVAVSSTPSVKTHELDVPRIGYIHSWQRTQDEGWVRAALDYYGVPYKYFADTTLREGNLRAKYDVIVYPHVGGNSASHLTGIPKTGPDAVPYKKSDITPNLGVLDQADDIRGGMGLDGLSELAKFVEEGGTLITEGSTAAFVADEGLTTGVNVEHPAQLFARGSILRATIADHKSPIAYGYEQSDLPVYFNQDPVFEVAAAGGGGFGGFGGGGGGCRGGADAMAQNITPNTTMLHISPYEGNSEEGGEGGGRGGRGGAGAGFGGRGGRGGGAPEAPRPRVVVEFAQNANDLLLSGTLAGGQALSGRAAALDVPLGKGHVVMFALRPWWRWQTQGTYFLGFNAILNWDHLDAGKAEPRGARGTTSAQR